MKLPSAGGRGIGAPPRADEAGHRAIVEGSIQGILIHREGLIRFANPVMARLLGYAAAADLLGRNVLNFVAPEDRKRVIAYERARARGEPAPARYEVRAGRRDGTMIWVECLTSSILWEGAPATLVTLVDLTERREAEASLRESEARYRTLVEGSIQGMYIHQDFVIRFANQALARMFGYGRPEDLIGRDARTLMAPHERARLERYREARLRGEAVPSRYEFQGVRRDGSSAWIECLPTVISWEGAPAILATFHDVTERRRAEERAEERAAKLTALSDLTRLITSTTDAREVFNAVARAAATLLGARVARVLVDEPAGRRLRARVSYSADPALEWPLSAIPVIPYGEGVTGRIYESRRAEFVEDIQQDPRWLDRRLVREGNLHGFAGLPLVAGDRVVGVLAILFGERRRFAPEEKELLGLLADQAAIAIENARLYQEVRDARDFLQSVTESSVDAIVTTDARGRITFFSPGAEEMLGHRAAEMLGRPVADLYGAGVAEAREVMERLLKEGRIRSYETRVRAGDGRPLVVDVAMSLLRDAGGAIVGTLGIAKDLTERKQLEESLHQAQKMEAVGQLAGGIAHDFNNLMTVVTSRSQLLLERLRPEDPLRRDVELFRKTAERATALTQKLLAFSRRQVLQPRLLDLNAVVAGLEPILRRLIGEDIDLVTRPEPALGRVRADPSQLEQVIANLAVNARDAMPEGGRLTIETANALLDETYARRHVAVTPGAYVMLAVSDTGIGMDEAVRARIFEPFFTTKEPGKGTGLGLSTVYGIVKQSGGNIWVYSEPGRGTTFKIYLPRVEGTEDGSLPVAAAARAEGGTETVLLVEDEDDLREVAREILETYGYTVLEARHPGEALLIAERHPGPIHLLVTDVVMPKMSGRDLAERLAPLRPEMGVLYMSGYTDDAIVRHGVLEPGTAFLEKPFDPATLARKVRDLLNR